MPQNSQKSIESLLKKNRKSSLFIRVLFVLISITLFIKIFNFVVDPRNGAGIHLNVNNRVLEYESPSNWLGDGTDYEIYQFSNEQMDKIIKKIDHRKDWKKYPLDSTANDSLNKWHGSIMQDPAAIEIIEKSNFKEFIPIIDNGYYLLVDRSSNDESEESQKKYGLRNFTVFILDIDNNLLYYFALDM